MASRVEVVIPLLCSIVMRPHLEYCAQPWAPNTGKTWNGWSKSRESTVQYLKGYWRRELVQEN